MKWILPKNLSTILFQQDPEDVDVILWNESQHAQCWVMGVDGRVVLKPAICYKTLTFNLMTLTLTWAACENTQIQNKLIKFSMSHFMIVYIEINYTCYQLFNPCLTYITLQRHHLISWIFYIWIFMPVQTTCT